MRNHIKDRTVLVQLKRCIKFEQLDNIYLKRIMGKVTLFRYPSHNKKCMCEHYRKGCNQCGEARQVGSKNS